MASGNPRISGVPLVHEDYAEDCRLYVPDHPSGNVFHNLYHKIDRFIISHIAGSIFAVRHPVIPTWVCACIHFMSMMQGLIYRNWMMAHVASILFEFIEYSLTFHFPNFNECWWDHVRVLTSA
jgi:phosphatidylserine synthase 2